MKLTVKLTLILLSFLAASMISIGTSSARTSSAGALWAGLDAGSDDEREGRNEGLRLRDPIVVYGAAATLGDLFVNAGEDRDWRLFTAPAPGASMLISAPRLAALLARRGHHWEPPRGRDRLQVTRYRRSIGEGEILAALRSHLDAGAPPRQGESHRLSLSPRSAPPIVAAPPERTSIVVKRWRRDPRNGAFQALIETTGGDDPPVLHRIAGRLESERMMPTPKRWMRRGEIIEADDLAMRRVVVGYGRGELIAEREGLIGMAVEKTLRPFEPIAVAAVAAAPAVRKNQSVPLSYRLGALTIEARAIALSDGRSGDVITFRNPRSRRLIKGIVGADGRAEAIAATP